MFTPGFLRCLANNASNPRAHLHTIARKCLGRIHRLRTQAGDPQLRVAISVALQRQGLPLEEPKAAAPPAADAAGEDGGGGEGGEQGGGTTAAAGASEGQPGKGAATEGDEVAAYVRQLQATFCRPAAAGGAAAAATGATAPAAATAGAGGGEERPERQWAVEQMCGAARRPDTPAELKLEVLNFLARHAFFSVGPPADAAAAPRDGALVAAAGRGPLPADLRRLCASRLIVLTDALSKLQHGSGSQQQQQGKDGAQGKGGKGKGSKGAAPAVAAAAADEQHGRGRQPAYLSEVVAGVEALHDTKAVTLATPLPPAAAEALGALRALDHKLSELLEETADGTSQEAQRLRALLHLAGLLQLHTLGDPAGADPDAAGDILHIAEVAFEGAELDIDSDGEGGACCMSGLLYVRPCCCLVDGPVVRPSPFLVPASFEFGQLALLRDLSWGSVLRILMRAGSLLKLLA